jgi:peptide/nickel transport system ATP-binding protein
VILEGTVPSPTNPPEGCRFHTRCPVIIPPEDWEGDQTDFKSAFTFRSRVESGEVEMDAVRDRLRSQDQEVTQDMVADYLLDQLLPGELSALPSSAADQLEEAALLLADGKKQGAKELLAEALPSPCEETPRTVDATENHRAACHRVDPEAPGEPTDWWN